LSIKIESGFSIKESVARQLSRLDVSRQPRELRYQPGLSGLGVQLLSYARLAGIQPEQIVDDEIDNTAYCRPAA
jgi:hypothetical protein